MNITLERLMECISYIDDLFLDEVETTDLSLIKNTKRKRIAKYSAAGLAVSFGVAMAYWMYKQKKAV